MNPSLRLCDTHEALSRAAAQQVVQALAVKPDLLLCAAGGTTPLRTYQLLAGGGAPPRLFQSLHVVKLDEWGGLAMNDPGTCEQQLQEQLVRPLHIGERYLGFRGDAAKPEVECARIREWLRDAGGIDLCVLGLGMNGHIAMNEPGEWLQPFAHVARLAESTLRHPMLAEARTQPSHGLTLGMAEILAAEEILLLVSGAAKRNPLRRLLAREVTTQFPASLLWLHPNWTLLCDSAAAAEMDLDL